MDQIEQLQQRMGFIEDKVNVMDKNAAVVNVLMERSIQVQEKFSNTLEKLSETMSDMKFTLSKMQEEISEVHRRLSEEKESREIDIEKISKEVYDVKTSIKNLDEKGKIDWMQAIKDALFKNLIPFGVISFIIAYIVEKLYK